jgi:hypothetical protein
LKIITVIHRIGFFFVSIKEVIGPEFSSEAEAISPILSSVSKEKGLVQVGFSTTAARLGDARKYPNFVRVVPNDDVQVEVRYYHHHHHFIIIYYYHYNYYYHYY